MFPFINTEHANSKLLCYIHVYFLFTLLQLITKINELNWTEHTISLFPQQHTVHYHSAGMVQISCDHPMYINWKNQTQCFWEIGWWIYCRPIKVMTKMYHYPKLGFTEGLEVSWIQNESPNLQYSSPNLLVKSEFELVFLKKDEEIKI